MRWHPSRIDVVRTRALEKHSGIRVESLLRGSEALEMLWHPSRTVVVRTWALENTLASE